MGAPNYEQQTIQQLPPEITVVLPAEDTTLLWVAGVVVPLVLGIGGWYVNHRLRGRGTKQ